MNRIDDPLNRLFRAAKKTAREVVAPPYGLETRVMAAWREARPRGAGLWDMSLLVRGLAVAIVIMGISFVPVLNQTTTPTDPFAEDLQLADSTIPADEAP